MATASTKTDDVVYAADQLPVMVTGMQSMAGKMWLPFLGMGFMIVAIAFVIGLVVSSSVSDWLSVSKLSREAAERGSALATQKAFIESTKVWLPSFKFLGLGMMLGGVTFLLATILGALRTGGAKVQDAMGAEVRIIKPPMTAKIFPMLMMAGMMILIVSIVVAIVTSTLAYDYWNHAIKTQLDAAATGSGLLSDLGTINAIMLWVTPFKFVGLAFLFAGIGMALATIIRVLRWQTNRLWEILS